MVERPSVTAQSSQLGSSFKCFFFLDPKVFSFSFKNLDVENLTFFKKNKSLFIIYQITHDSINSHARVNLLFLICTLFNFFFCAHKFDYIL